MKWIIPMSRKRYRHVRCVATLVAWILLTNEALPSEIELRPPELYEGFDARKVVLEESGSRLALDPRALKFGKEPHGVVVTDPIDLGSRDGIVGLAGTIASVAIEVAANVPNGTTVEMETRHGTRRLDQSLWSPWRRSLSLRETVRVAGSRYLQLRITLQGAVPDKRPALLGIKLKPTRTAEAPWIGQLTIVRQDIQKIVRSPIAFHYERPDQEKIARFRRDAKLDEVVAEGRDDFEKLVRLLDWVGSGTN